MTVIDHSCEKEGMVDQVDLCSREGKPVLCLGEVADDRGCEPKLLTEFSRVKYGVVSSSLAR